MRLRSRRLSQFLVAVLALAAACHRTPPDAARPMAALAPGEGTTRLVDVGGRRLEATIYGRGDPTLVLLSGLEMTQDNWRPVISDLATVGTVVTYDRAGIGASELGNRPVDGVESARDLHTLLARLGAPRPYVLVAHSHGGNIARIFASMYPHVVSGMVLEEVQHERVLEELRKALSGKDLETFDRVLAPGFAPPAQPRTEADYRSATREQVRQGVPLPPVPLVVLTVAGRARDMRSMFSAEAVERLVALDVALMRELASSVPEGRLELVEGSGHVLHADRPEVLVRAVREVITRVQRAP